LDTVVRGRKATSADLTLPNVPNISSKWSLLTVRVSPPTNSFALFAGELLLGRDLDRSLPLDLLRDRLEREREREEDLLYERELRERDREDLDLERDLDRELKGLLPLSAVLRSVPWLAMLTIRTSFAY